MKPGTKYLQVKPGLIKLLQLQREASALRDDLKKLVDKLNHLYVKKMVLLDKILLSEVEKKYAIKSKNSDVLLKNLEENDVYIDKINSIDFTITETTEKICNTIGIKKEQLNEFIEDSDEPEFVQLLEFQNKTKEYFQTLISEREEIIDGIEKESMVIKEDIDSLYRIYKIKNSS